MVTRPNLVFSVSSLASRLSNPSPQHIDEARKVIAYSRDNKYYGLQYGERITSGAYEVVFEESSDAAYEDDLTSGRITEGPVFCLFPAAIHRRSKNRATVTKSSTEAELFLSRAGSEVVAWKRLFRQLSMTRNKTYQHCAITRGLLEKLRRNNRFLRPPSATLIYTICCYLKPSKTGYFQLIGYRRLTWLLMD